MSCRKRYHIASYEYYGKTYPSKKALSDAFGIRFKAVNKWQNKGYTFLESVDMARAAKISQNFNHNVYVVDGKTYRSHEQIAEDYGINKHTLNSGASRKEFGSLQNIARYLSSLSLEKRLMKFKGRPGVNCIKCGVLFSPATKRYKEENWATTKYCPCCSPAHNYDFTQKIQIVGDYCGVGFCRECGNAHEIPKSDNMVKIKDATCRSRLCDDCKPVVTQLKRKESKRRNRKKWGNWKQRRRANTHGVAFDSGITAKSVAEEYGYKCQLCGVTVELYGENGGYKENGATVGHHIPVSRKGSHTWDNVWCECHKCNTQKGTMTTDEYLARDKDQLPLGLR